MNTLDVLVVKDEEGILRPRVGIWLDNKWGRNHADEFVLKDKGVTVVKATLTENLT